MKDEVWSREQRIGASLRKWRQYGNRTCTQVESEGKRERSNGESGRDIRRQGETEGKRKRHTETVRASKLSKAQVAESSVNGIGGLPGTEKTTETEAWTKINHIKNSEGLWGT